MLTLAFEARLSIEDLTPTSAGPFSTRLRLTLTPLLPPRVIPLLGDIAAAATDDDGDEVMVGTEMTARTPTPTPTPTPPVEPLLLRGGDLAGDGEMTLPDECFFRAVGVDSIIWVDAARQTSER